MQRMQTMQRRLTATSETREAETEHLEILVNWWIRSFMNIWNSEVWRFGSLEVCMGSLHSNDKLKQKLVTRTVLRRKLKRRERWLENDTVSCILDSARCFCPCFSTKDDQNNSACRELKLTKRKCQTKFSGHWHWYSSRNAYVAALFSVYFHVSTNVACQTWHVGIRKSLGTISQAPEILLQKELADMQAAVT